MTVDYTHPRHGMMALGVLSEAGIDAVLTPYKALGDHADLATTHLVVHRVEVPDADAARAVRLLTDAGLLARTAG